MENVITINCESLNELILKVSELVFDNQFTIKEVEVGMQMHIERVTSQKEDIDCYLSEERFESFRKAYSHVKKKCYFKCNMRINQDVQILDYREYQENRFIVESIIECSINM